MGYTDGILLGCNEGIKLGSSDGKVIGTILGNVDGNTLELDFGTELIFIYGYFDGYNDGKPKAEFLEIHPYLLMLKCMVVVKA